MKATREPLEQIEQPTTVQTDRVQADAPFISVIMPVYNVEDYIAWSAKSVLDQSYPCFELICVDDGSTDASGVLVDALAAADERIVAIHQQNRGLSGARNTGIRHATGAVVVFLDSDDALRSDALQTIAAVYDATNFDVLTYGAAPYPSFETSTWLTEVLSPRDAEYDAFHPDILFKEKSHPFAWRTACRREFLDAHGIAFDESIKFGEDQVFHFQIYPLSTKTVFIADKLVDYRVKRSDSLMSTSLGNLQNRAQEHIVVLDKILSDWENQGLLDTWASQIFEWSVGFILPSLMLNQDHDSYPMISHALAAIWRTYFSESFLENQMKDKNWGLIVDMVMNDTSPVPRRRMIKTLFTVRRHSYGVRYACRQIFEKPLSRIKSKRIRAEQAQWAENDERDLQAAKNAYVIGSHLTVSETNDEEK